MKAFAVARNVPLAMPEGIVSLAGTVRLVELDTRPTVPPSAPLRVTVHVLEAPGAKVPGLHTTELTMVTVLTPTVPPVPVTAIASPASEAPSVLLMVIGTALEPDRVTDTVATTPSEMVFEFNPHAMHI